ncbi:MlaD family protein [Legionella sp. 16cNR16C]|uniref:MlaD family protein n=1 Tax=Legionella sp. 16cNR16C TaxID=2905656 RepID=UPI001E5BABFE|nr:MlaD family protein [Legionella sp. 16cNR16C]MCE3043771.1 MlaD family protein [Legionella sp. 16cNR16C]
MEQERFYIGTGIFVFFALILAVFGTLFVYNQYLHGKIETYVMLFKGSLSGLDATSPITYRGVKIGEVKRVELTATKSKTNVSIPVYVEFFVEKSFEPGDNPIQILIQNGIVATISSPNLLTGTSSIELVLAEKKQASVKARTFHGVPLFPTEVAVEDDMSAKDTMRTARRTLNDISNFVKSKELKEAIIAIQTMADSINQFADLMTGQIPSALIYWNESLKEVSKMAYSVRTLTDYLARHPDALLRGR